MKDFLAKRRRVFVLLTPAILGAIFIILCLLGMNHSATTAEGRTVFMTRFDAGQIWQIAGEQGEGPMYYWLAKAWAHFFGHTDYNIRVLSALLGAMAIVFAFLWLKYKYGLAAAVLAASLMTMAPLFVHFGQSAESATLIIALTFAANYFLQLAIDHRSKYWWMLYALTMILGIWTNGIFALVLIAHLIYIWRSAGKKVFTRKVAWLSLFAIIVLGAIHCVYYSRPLVMAEEADMMNSLSNSVLYMSGMLPSLIATICIALLACGAYQCRLYLLGFIMGITWLGALLLPWFDLVKVPFLAVIPMMLVGVFIAKMIRQKKVIRLLASGIGIISIALCVCGLVNVYRNDNTDINTGESFAARRIIGSIDDLNMGAKNAIITDDVQMYYQLATYTTEDNPVLFVGTSSAKAIEFDYAGRVDDFASWRERHDEFWQVFALSEEIIEVPGYEGWRISQTSGFLPNNAQYGYKLVKFVKESTE